MAHRTGILDLPVELLLLILAGLDVTSFLKLTSTCKALHAPNIFYEPSYWSNLVRTTFRVPNQPVLAHDGVRWQKLYKRMLTQSRVYLWGNNDRGSLVVDTPLLPTFQAQGIRGIGRYNFQRASQTAVPEPMRGVKDLGVISDLQCGGWSTTLLTAKGAVYTAGVIDGLGYQRPEDGPVPLLYPPGFPSPVHRYDSSTAVKQLSVGRCHVLALSDSGRIWSWHDAARAALHVKFLHHDVVEHAKTNRKGVVEKVVAGWNKSAALIQGTGIVLWEPLQRANDDTSFADAALIMQSEVIANTSFRVTDSTAIRSEVGADAPAMAIGEVSNFIVLERIVLFNTHLGKLFVSALQRQAGDRNLNVPVEVPIPTGDDAEVPFVTDVQGSFQSFAIFTKSGAVLTGKEDDIMDHLSDHSPDRELFKRIPALQHKDVIQVAFGDYHFHALHGAGHITSYGKELQHCGAFGLGRFDLEGVLRGLKKQGGSQSELVPHAYSQGRRIWFQREKQNWLTYLMSGSSAGEAEERHSATFNSWPRGPSEPGGFNWMGELSSWIEQEGQDWEGKFGLQHADEDGLGAHFALSVTAAGWHSGALVLVNEDLQQKIRDACEIPDPSLPPASTSSTPENESMDTPPSLINSAVTTATHYGRRFLGLRPRNEPPDGNGTQNGGRDDQFAPTRRGNAPRPGMQYIWHDDHFPRLVLSDGSEMPGTIPFDEWRYGRPEWDLSVSL